MHGINTLQKIKFGTLHKIFKISLDILHPSSHSHHIARKFLQKQKKEAFGFKPFASFFIHLLIYIYAISVLISRLYL